MRYTKPALTFDQQSQRLIERGLIVRDRNFLINSLKTVNYYRLSAYWYTFKQIDSITNKECFIPNTKFEIIWDRYNFDRKLRLILMNAIEYIEVSILRTRMVEIFSTRYGPFGYLNHENFNPSFGVYEYQKLIIEVNESVERSKEDFIIRYRSKYTDETNLPLWMLVEVMSFGQLFTFFRNLNLKDKQDLSRQFRIYLPVLESWLRTLNFIRNACAHHARIWNREIPIKPLIPNKKHNPEWYAPYTFNNKKIFVVLTLIKYLLNEIGPFDTWKKEVKMLILSYPDIPFHWMGIPENWEDNPIWQK